MALYKSRNCGKSHSHSPEYMNKMKGGAARGTFEKHKHRWQCF